MDETLLKRLRACPTLPSLPAVAVQVLELAQQPEADLGAIAGVIARDAALAGKLLKTVNSSFYARSSKVATISQATVVLGLNTVKTLVLGFSLVGSMKAPAEKCAAGAGLDYGQFWARSLYSATAARALAARAGVKDVEEAFLAALLADVGQLVLDRVLAGEYARVVEGVGHAELWRAERAAFRATHAEVGAYMAEQWKLPEQLARPIAAHHAFDDPAAASASKAATPAALKPLCELVAVACACGDLFAGDRPAEALASARALLVEKLKFDPESADAALSEIAEKARETATLFDLKVSGESFADIVKRANEALVELTLQSQHQTEQLQQQNAELQHQARTDKLTGLANRGAFDEFLAGAFARARRDARPLALVMMDVDRFKKVNDEHGHPAGDAVLRHVAALVRRAARAGMLAARYGGEEMALVLPGAARPLAAALAEATRRALEASAADLGGGAALKVTASFGVAVLEPGGPFARPEHLVMAADRALYAAKAGGRNNVKVFALTARKAA